MKYTILYSKKSTDANSIIYRHRYSLRGKRAEVKIKTNFKIKSEYWDEVNECWNQKFKVIPARKAEDKALNKQIDDFNTKFALLKKKISDYVQENPFPTYDDLYTLIFGEKLPKKQSYPELLSEFISFYISEKSKLIAGKQKPIATRTVQKLNTIKNRIDKYFPKLHVVDVDDDFRDRYTLMMSKLKHKQSYIIRELRTIKTICKFAGKKLDISKDILYWTFIDTDTDKYLDPIFSLDEIEKIKNAEMLASTLENARDWLLISCYTGQRVSDLLNMSSHNIIEEEYYNIFQQKGQKSIVIWLMPEVREILKKRGGEFPKKYSPQKYNDYIKLVAFKAGLHEVIKGSKEIDKRKVVGMYPKWELVTSHIGRRTFVSLFRDKLGYEHTMTQTGHSSTRMVDLYNKTSPLDKARKVKQTYISAQNSEETNTD